MRDKVLIEIVIPAYNEEKLIAKSIQKINHESGLDKKKIRIIVVDDASTDSTWQVIEVMSKLEGNIRAIKLARNMGKEFAIRSGLRIVRAQYSVTVDADGEHPFEEITKMLNLAIETSSNIVFARREKSQSPFFSLRELLSNLFNFIIGLKNKEIRGLTDYILLDNLARNALLSESHGIYRMRVQEIGYKKTSYLFRAIYVKRKSRWNMSTLTKLAFGIVLFHSSIFRRLFFLIMSLSSLIIIGLVALVFLNSADIPRGYLTLLFLLLINLILTIVSIGYLYLALTKKSGGSNIDKSSVWLEI